MIMMTKKLIITVALLLSHLPVMAVQYDAPTVARTGVVQELSIASYEIVIEGHRYQVSKTAQVEIAGTYGAYTMLAAGMRVEFEYRRFRDGRREIYRIRELLPDESMERA